MLQGEDSYGHLKRIEFVREAVAAARPKSVLDVGCGTGVLLTSPIALSFPEIEFVGLDIDRDSIAWARSQNPQANMRFVTPDALDPAARFDLVIASEVLEHVENPAGFLVSLRDHLVQGGRIIITVPNGYGPYEFFSLVEIFFFFSGLQFLLRRLRNTLIGAPNNPSENDSPPTLAVSPHLNFFSFGGLSNLFKEAGYGVLRYRPRTLLCGYLVDALIGSPLLTAWNAGVVDRLPAFMASDWMFEIELTTPAKAPVWRRGTVSRLRKRINEKRWGIA